MGVPDRGTAQALLGWLSDHGKAMLSTLEALVRTESPSRDPDAQERIFALLSALVEDMGLAVLRVPGDQTGGLWLARPEARTRGAGVQLVVAHADTVWPHGTLRTMPFAVRDGRAWGPGVYDTKAGLVQAMFALRALTALDLRPALTPVLVVNADEELGSPETSRQIARLARIAARAWVLEPSLGPEGRLKTARKGVGHFALRVTGRAAHAGLDPERGISANVELAHQVLALHALNRPDLGRTVNVGEVRGGTRRNVVPADAVAEIDVRVRTLADAAAVEAEIRALRPVTAGAQLAIAGGFVKVPMEPSPGGTALWEAARRAADALGIPLDHGAAGGASDGNTTARWCPTLDGLGAVGDGAHAVHEHVVLDALPQRAALLALLLLGPR